MLRKFRAATFSRHITTSPVRYKPTILLLTFAAIVFRCELVLLLGAVCLEALICIGWGQFLMCIGNILMGVVPSAALTVFLDSFYWRRTDYSLDLCQLAKDNTSLNWARTFAVFGKKLVGSYYYDALGFKAFQGWFGVGEKVLINFGRQLCFEFTETSIYGRTLRNFTWPELSVFIFNGPQDRSGAWGVMSRHWYFTHALPKTLGLLLLLALAELKFAFLSPAGGRARRKSSSDPGARAGSEKKSYGLRQPIVVRTFVFWVLIPVCGLSLIGHKEIRFIFPSILGCVVCLALTLQNSFVASSAVRSRVLESAEDDSSSEAESASAERSTTTSESWRSSRRPERNNSSSGGGKKSSKRRTPFLLPSVFQYRLVVVAIVAANIGLAVLRLTASAYNYPAGWAVSNLANWRLIRETHLLEQPYKMQRGFEHRREQFELEREDFVRPVADSGHPAPALDLFWASERVNDYLLDENTSTVARVLVVPVGRVILGVIKKLAPVYHHHFWQRFLQLDGGGGPPFISSDGIYPDFRGNLTLQRGTVHGGPMRKRGEKKLQIQEHPHPAARSLTFWQIRRILLYFKSWISSSVSNLDEQRGLLRNLFESNYLQTALLAGFDFSTAPVRIANAVELVESQIRFNVTAVIASSQIIHIDTSFPRLVPADSAGLVDDEYFATQHKHTTNHTLKHLFVPVVSDKNTSWLVPARIPLYLHLDRFAVNSGVTQYTTRNFVKVTKETVATDEKTGKILAFPDIIVTEERPLGKEGVPKKGNQVQELLAEGAYVLLQEHTGFSHFDYLRRTMHLKVVLYTYVRRGGALGAGKYGEDFDD